jgi:hypothetical protein
MDSKRNKKSKKLNYRVFTSKTEILAEEEELSIRTFYTFLFIFSSFKENRIKS